MTNQLMETAWAEYCSHFPVTYMGRVVNEQRRADFEAGFAAGAGSMVRDSSGFITHAEYPMRPDQCFSPSKLTDLINIPPLKL